MAVITPFAIAGTILLIGFIGDYLFNKFKIPDILILILLGFFMGPVFNIISPSSMGPVVPVFISLSLIIILFNGGLNLKLTQVFKGGTRAIALATLGFISTIFITSAFTHYLLGWDWLTGALLGSIIGGTSSSIVIPLIERIKTSETAKTIMNLESVFTDTLVIVASLAILQLITAGGSSSFYTLAAKNISSAFSIGIVLGLIAGVFWLKILRHIRGEKYDEMSTLAFLFLFYAITETLGGNGAIFALIFGLVLGNGILIQQMLKIRKKKVEAGITTRRFQAQISFFMRTFFFVYLGMIVTITNIASTLLTLIYAAVLTILLLFMRFVVVHICAINSPALSENKQMITVILARGLSAAVLSQMVIAAGIPHAQLLSQFVIFTILVSTMVSVVGATMISAHPHLAGAPLTSIKK